MPLGAVWNMLCRRANVPEAAAWVAAVEQYETDVLAKRA